VGDRGGLGCELLYLPPYSPDLNAIVEAFADPKAFLRRTARTARRSCRR
jgi:transposase